MAEAREVTNRQGWPGQRLVNVVPSDTDDLPFVTNGFRVGVPGDVAVVTIGGDVAIWPNAQIGEMIPLKVTRILATGTDAEEIVAVS